MVSSRPPSRAPVFVDTSGWADPLLHNTTDFRAMDAYSRELAATKYPLVTTDDVLNELVALVTARTSTMPRADLIRFVNAIRSQPQVRIVHVDEGIWTEAWALLERALDKRWSLVDATSFVVMRRFHLTEAFTSDHHFVQAGFVRVPR